MGKLWQVLLIAIGSGPLYLGCSTAEDYDMGQTIAMGPFTFQAQSAWATTSQRGHPQIGVEFRLVSDSGVLFHFSDLFNDNVDAEGNKTTKIWLSPRTKVVDTHGHGFAGVVSEESARFIIFEVKLRDQDRFNEEHRDMGPGNFRLVITNPDPKRG